MRPTLLAAVSHPCWCNDATCSGTTRSSTICAPLTSNGYLAISAALVVRSPEVRNGTPFCAEHAWITGCRIVDTTAFTWWSSKNVLHAAWYCVFASWVTSYAKTTGTTR